ncbi:MAG TPA: hypothetical protein PK926_02495 [Spirochaetota bacterium]|nr:hypothetical protein [Spirochaetota bacterium]HPI88380.1 hypothetical protein [Spirochaetota bacterium]HPR46762.1 hypothetical protein [Spirochaetota bacterium]
MHYYILILSIVIVLLSLLVIRYSLTRSFSKGKKDRRKGERRVHDRRIFSYESRVEKAFEDMEYFQEKQKVMNEKRKAERRNNNDRRKKRKEY